MCFPYFLCVHRVLILVCIVNPPVISILSEARICYFVIFLFAGKHCSSTERRRKGNACLVIYGYGRMRIVNIL